MKSDRTCRADGRIEWALQMLRQNRSAALEVSVVSQENSNLFGVRAIPDRNKIADQGKL
jgi:hypothetical protein